MRKFLGSCMFHQWRAARVLIENVDIKSKNIPVQSKIVPIEFNKHPAHAQQYNL